MSTRLGILVAGIGGAIGSTVAAGLTLVRQGHAKPTAILTESESMDVGGGKKELIRDALGLARLEDIHVAGWDVGAPSFDQILARHNVVSSDLRRKLEGQSDIATIFEGWYADGDVCRKHTGETARSWRSAYEQARADIRDYKATHKLDQVVVACLLPTRPSVPHHPAHDNAAEFDALLDGPVENLAADMVYLYAAIKEGCAWMNFTPNQAEVPALVTLAIEHGAPLAGRDGKTGQTYIKTVLAPAFRDRHLHVRGWFSTNILGNQDGKALREPAALKNKIETKASALDSILGYPVGGDEPSHVVTIHYYPPRGDAKEAWDNIDLEGFLGEPMQLKVNFLCRDSILAAPLVLDMARLLGLARSRGERGFQHWLGGFFKFPLFPEGTPVEHDFFAQMGLLRSYLANAYSTKGRAG